MKDQPTCCAGTDGNHSEFCPTRAFKVPETCATSAEWDRTLVANVVGNCRQQIERLRMKMPMNVALALGRADECLADAEAWIRAESDISNLSNRKPA